MVHYTVISTLFVLRYCICNCVYIQFSWLKARVEQMNIKNETEKQIEPVINLKDGVFFGSFGLALSLITAVTDQIDLPVYLERGFLSSLFFDHIPFNSIATLLLLMTAMVCISVAISRKKGSDKEVLVHISNRVSQLCSPAFFIVVGQAIGIVIVGVFSSNSAYYGYAITFLVFAFLIFIMSGMSNVITSQYDLAHRKLSPKVAFAGAAILLLATLFQFVLDRSPITVEVPFSVSDYEILETLADKQGVEVEALIKQLAVEGYKTNKQFKSDS